MNEKRKDTDALERGDGVYALFGLLAQTGTGDGPGPGDAELLEYLRGRLEESRRREIRSHIAHNPKISDRVMVLAEELAEKEADSGEQSSVIDSRERFSNRLRFSTRYVLTGISALAASVLVAFMVFSPEADVSSDRNVRVVQSPGSAQSAVEQEADAIRLGYASGKTSSGSAFLGNSLVADCTGDCSENDKLRQLGAVLRNLEESCQSTGAIEISAAARTSLRGLASGRNAIIRDPWRRYVNDLNSAANRSDQALCRVTLKMTASLEK